jgi:hypothetical protein
MGFPRQAVALSSPSLRRQSKSSSKSERGSYRVATSDRFESNPSSPVAAQVEVASKNETSSRCDRGVATRRGYRQTCQGRCIELV